MLAAVLLTCTLAAGCYGAAVPSTDTLVVTSTQVPTASPVSEDLTTQTPPQPIKLLEMDVKSEVTLRYAQTAVVTKVKNPAALAQETTFRVLLPETAFISGFLMILNGKPYKAYVKGKEEAKEIYNQAVSQGVGAAHIATKARDSNHFTVSVNVEPRTEAVFNLTYEELLVRRNGVYNQAINLHPGGLVPSLKVTVHIKESQKITELRVPEVRTGNEVDATSDDKQNSIATVERGHDDREATITFTPDIQEQRRLMEIFSQKSKESAGTVYRPWHSSDGKQKASEFVLGQFVVQYDVARPKDGEILVSDGYFVHFFAPESLPPLSKQVVFVLDTSGSMMNRKIAQLKEAMTSILAELNDGDFFSIIEFSSSAKVHELKEADEDIKPQHVYFYEPNDVPIDLVTPFPVTPENIAKAKVIVNRLIASGGTNIGLALDVAVRLVNRGVDWKPNANSTSTPKDKEDKNVEPIIIFLTDGDPTVGELDPKRILNRLTEMNSGPNKATIFSLAFGEDADRSFLRKVALRNSGFMRHIYEGADAVLQLRDFYRQVASPLLSHVNFTYPPEQVVEGSITSSKFRNYYSGSERAVAGRVAPDVTELAPSVEAFCGVDDSFTRKKYRVVPKVPVGGNRGGFLPLERVWAYLTIQQLLEHRDANNDIDVYVSPEAKDKSPEKQALELALKYEFVTPLTSLVVVKPNETNAVDAESVDENNGSDGGRLPMYDFAAAGLPALASQYHHSGGRRNGYKQRRRYGIIKGFLKTSSCHSYRPTEAEGFKKGDCRDKQSDLRPGMAAAVPQYLSSPLFDAVEDVSVDEEEYHIDSLGHPWPPVKPPPSPLAPTSPQPDAYHLQGYSWLQQYVDLAAGAIRFQVNGTEVTLKLSMTPVESGAACDKAIPNDVAGRCVYVTQCDAARHIDIEAYKNIYCLLGNDGYAGVCCPESKDTDAVLSTPSDSSTTAAAR